MGSFRGQDKNKMHGLYSSTVETKTPLDLPMAASLAAVSEQLSHQPQSAKLLVAQVTSDSIPSSPGKGKSPAKGDSRAKVDKKKKKAKKAKKRNAKATLYGLSSITRDGDVVVNLKNSQTMVMTKFIVGPLTLRVEKEFGRGAKKNVRSATATTTDMRGRLNLKVVHGGSASLQSIRVLQPKQVRVDSSIDDEEHDKTREFVWKRSSHIAHLVGQKLTHATRSMLKPAPAPAAQRARA